MRAYVTPVGFDQTSQVECMDFRSVSCARTPINVWFTVCVTLHCLCFGKMSLALPPQSSVEVAEKEIPF